MVNQWTVKMEQQIKTKFIVVNEAGMRDLLFLTHTLAAEKFSGLLPAPELKKYTDLYTQQRLAAAVNNFSNQWLIVYVDDKPAGYALITSAGKKPDSITGNKAKRLADFGVLQQYAGTACKQVLMDKCLLVSKAYDVLWLHEYAQSPLLPFFEENGFHRDGQAAALDELPLPAVFLIKEK